MGFMEGYNMVAGNKQLKLEADRNRMAWTQMAEAKAERDKKFKIDAKAAESFLLNDEARQRFIGKTPLEIQAGSYEDKIGWADAYMKDQATKAVVQQIADAKRAAGNSEAFGTALQDASRSTFTSPSKIGDFAPGITVPSTKTPTMEETWRALAAKPGALSAHEAAPFIHAMAGGNGNDPYHAMNAQANMMNARANLDRAMASKTPPVSDWPEVPGYTRVPDNKGGFHYISSKPSAQQERLIEDKSRRKRSLETQLAEYEKLIGEGDTHTGWDLFGAGKKYTDLRDEVQKQLDSTNAEITDLQRGYGSGPVKKAAPSGGGSIWDDFQNFNK